jgi:plastocyanin
MTRTAGWITSHALVAGLLVGLAACGGGDDSTPTGPGSTPGPSGATITIAEGRVTPAAVTINIGQSVTFVNNNGRGHNVTSDPHPNHTDCPAINAVGNMANGQTRLTDAFTTARTCGFHNHDDPDNANFRGSITIR